MTYHIRFLALETLLHTAAQVSVPLSVRPSRQPDITQKALKIRPDLATGPSNSFAKDGGFGGRKKNVTNNHVGAGSFSLHESRRNLFDHNDRSAHRPTGKAKSVCLHLLIKTVEANRNAIHHSSHALKKK